MTKDKKNNTSILRTKRFVDFPKAKNISEVLEHMQKGGEVWQEISDEYPQCCGYDDVFDLLDCFGEIQEDGSILIELDKDDNLHLVKTDIS